MKIATNTKAINSHRVLSSNGRKKEKISEKLSSGLRINSAADDVAGEGISEKMRAQIKGLDMADKNVEDGISMLQCAEGSASEICNMIQRMRELSIESATDTFTSYDREKLDDEFQQLKEEITDITERTNFNTKNLLDGSLSVAEGKSPYIHIGANENQNLSFDLDSITSESLGISDLKLNSREDAEQCIEKLDEALSKTTDVRVKIGAYQNRLQYTGESLKVSSDNTTSSLSKIEDADMALNMAQLTTMNVLTNASQSMLAQANQSANNVLNLLQ